MEMKQASAAGKWPVLAIAYAILIVWIGLRALVAPVNHDESQYVAAAVLASEHLIFRDFLSLQPPLHAWLMAPVAIPGGTTLVALRLADAALGVGALALLHAGLTAAGVSRRFAIAMLFLAAACQPFQFAASVVRNDILPMALLAGALAAGLVGCRRPDWRWWTLAGLLLGLAGSTKLSYGPPLAIAGLFLCWQAVRGRIAFAIILAFAIGGVVGLLPLLAGFLAQPQVFVYGTLEFGAEAPFDWYRANGLNHRLGLAGKLLDMIRYAALGPMLVAFLALILFAFDGHRAEATDLRRSWLYWMLAAGLIAAALPTPMQRQYLLPMLPPLFVLLGLAIEMRRQSRTKGRQTVVALLGLSFASGLVADGIILARGRPSPIDIDRNARWMGKMLAGADGAIFTLSPEHAIASGRPIDPLSATGPFVLRSGTTIDRARALVFAVPTPETLPLLLDRCPPAAILTGYERGSRRFRIAPDEIVVRYALSRGYHPLAVPDGEGALYVRTQLPPVRC
ncbi:4-amino-4-deoxy-L-arabinose transferase-like glycosyltransferase [Sphingomonas zeicaulis]|uniref:glycosyltransferase family 39 protein n=1 Tax=Sphingomonas zeicaulis TaxID=1632740 RepID=UPI003D1A4E26